MTNVRQSGGVFKTVVLAQRWLGGLLMTTRCKILTVSPQQTNQLDYSIKGYSD